MLHVGLDLSRTRLDVHVMDQTGTSLAVTTAARETRFVPMQAKIGDYALFFRKAAVEITFEEKRYLVVPQAAILVLVRDDLPVVHGDDVRMIGISQSRLKPLAHQHASVSGNNTSSAITTPTNDGGKPTAATPALMAGVSTFARPTTATSASRSRLSRKRTAVSRC